MKIRFVDQRKRSKSLAFRIFHAKKPEKDRLYPGLIRCAEIALSSRNIQYGHKVNLATEQHGFITYFNIEDGNPADATLYWPALDACQADYQGTPESVVADGGYASHDHVRQARQRGVKRALFNKPSALPGVTRR